MKGWFAIIMMPFKEMARLDKLIHEPARLAIMSALEACTLAEFLFLQELTGLTKGNLSSHLSKLEKVGYIQINKNFVRQKIPHTTIRITREGQAAILQYWDQLDRIREITKQWQKNH
ncbi:transcriptional regulator [Hazenella coriacea]|uniref:ArsR family transcriptional regulator n=1 Tax=Hazenella coriacea TaxID=1179467 RepID=A0A4R3L3M1_9BACL|nr:transcriptional regulator [Hazenella coriacea]TCS93862.1 ArsR family transcriptional regulator [Hazenella coriacea]